MNFSYINAINILMEVFPEFKESSFYDQEDADSAYVTYSSFMKFALENILNEPFRFKFFNFINFLYSIPNINSDFQDLIGIEILEKFEENEELKKIALGNLNYQALNFFKYNIK